MANEDRLLVHGHRAHERRRGPGHALGLFEDDLSLLLLGGGAVDLRTALFVGDQAVEPERRGEGRLAVLPGDLLVRAAETARAIGAHPAEQRCHEELLPRLEYERLAQPATLAVAAEPAEVDRYRAEVRLPHQAARVAGLQVADLALDHKLFEAADHHTPAEDVVDVSVDSASCARFYHPSPKRFWTSPR